MYRDILQLECDLNVHGEEYQQGGSAKFKSWQCKWLDWCDPAFGHEQTDGHLVTLWNANVQRRRRILVRMRWRSRAPEEVSTRGRCRASERHGGSQEAAIPGESSIWRHRLRGAVGLTPA